MLAVTQWCSRASHYHYCLHVCAGVAAGERAWRLPCRLHLLRDTPAEHTQANISLCQHLFCAHKRQRKTKVVKWRCRLRACRLLCSPRMLLQHHLQLELVASRRAAASGNALGCLCSLCSEVYVATVLPAVTAANGMLAVIAWRCSAALPSAGVFG